ncbi:MAG: tetratricopeptide repeat protein [Armatimonadota bacterium]|nr:tetratricopeptide repeat protein [Armatimonadota bacterium]
MIRARLLGEFEVEVDGRRVARFRTRRTAHLLAYLLRYPRLHAREALARLFWSELADESALNNLRVSLSSLRGILEPPGVPRGSVLIATRRHVGLRPEVVETDVAQFEAAAARVQSAPSEEERAHWAAHARALYRGDFLPDCTMRWAQAERERLRALYESLPVPETLAPVRPAPTPPHASRPVSGLGIVVGVKLPAPERTTLAWLRTACTVAGGVTIEYRGEQLIAFFTDLDHLARFLGEAATQCPSMALALDLGHVRRRGQRTEGAPLRVVERLLPLAAPSQAVCTQRVAGVLMQASGAPLTTRPLGAYWLDAEFPRETLYQLVLPGLDAPPVLHAPRALSKSLPRVPGTFIGRDAELATLRMMLERSSGGVFSVVGAPGCGKTRFALECAWQTETLFGEARWWVVLSHPSESLYELWARRLNWDATSEHQFRDMLGGLLGAQPALLGIDLLHPPSPAQVDAIRALREAVPQLRVLLATPRPLHLEDEYLYELPPLEIPPEGVDEVETLWRYSAVRLFVERAQQVNPDFRLNESNAPLIAEVVRHSEGLPLAIELLAARLRSMTLAQLRAHLNDTRWWKHPSAASAFGRSLWDSLSVSYASLTPPQQTLLHRLSVLPNGWELECACSVLGVEPDDLETLTHTGLLHRCEERYTMLHIVQQFIAQFVGTDDRRAVLSHYLYYWSERLAGLCASAPDWASLEAERANFDFALEWGVEYEPVSALRLALALAPFWESRGGSARALEALLALPTRLLRPEEQLQAARIAVIFATRRGAIAAAQRLLDIFLPLAEAHPTLIQAARLWFAAGFYHWVQGDYAASERYLRRALERSRALNVPDDQAEALVHLGVVLWLQGRLADAVPLFEQALELAPPSMPRLKLNALGNLAATYYQMGDLARAEALMHTAAQLAQQQGDLRTYATMLNNWGVWRAEQGDYERARQLYQESLALWREIHEPMGETICINNLGDLAMREGNYATARTLFLHSLDMAQRYRVLWYRYHPLQNLSEVAEREQNWEEATLWARRALAAMLQHHSPAQARPLLLRISRYAQHLGNYPLAVQCLTAAERLTNDQDSTLWIPLEQAAGREAVLEWRIKSQQVSLESLLADIALPITESDD